MEAIRLDAINSYYHAYSLSSHSHSKESCTHLRPTLPFSLVRGYCFRDSPLFLLYHQLFLFYGSFLSPYNQALTIYHQLQNSLLIPLPPSGKTFSSLYSKPSKNRYLCAHCPHYLVPFSPESTLLMIFPNNSPKCEGYQ